MIAIVAILHVGVAAAWFGHKLLIPADHRSSLAGGHNTAQLLLPRLARAESLGIATAIGTIATGALLIAMIGPRVVSTGVWVGLGLTLAAVVLGALAARPASVDLRSSVALGDLTAEAVLW